MTTEIRLCAQGCGRKLAKLNKTGNCNHCFKADVNGIRSAYMRKAYNGTEERRTCVARGCSNVILKNNTTGYCRSCFDSNVDNIFKDFHREKGRRQRARIAGSSEKIGRICQAAGCKNVIRSDNKMGYCKPCYLKNVDNIATITKRKRATGSEGPEIRNCAGCSKKLHGSAIGDFCKECKKQGKHTEKFCISCNKKIKKSTKWGYCRECYRNNTDGIRSLVEKSLEANLSNWRNKHGVIITDEEAEEYWNATECDLCGEPMLQQESHSPLGKVMDHCHESMRYRGAIHRRCNSGLGYLGDDLQKIIDNVKRYQKLTENRC